MTADLTRGSLTRAAKRDQLTALGVSRDERERILGALYGWQDTDLWISDQPLPKPALWVPARRRGDGLLTIEAAVDRVIEGGPRHAG